MEYVVRSIWNKILIALTSIENVRAMFKQMILNEKASSYLELEA